MDERPPWDRPDDEKDDVDSDTTKPTEGVRIIGAEEAAEAIEKGAASPRRPEGEPRYGDRPTPPAAEGSRPTLRFPHTGADEPDAPRPRVSGSTGLPHWSDPPTGEVPRILPGGDEQAPEDDLSAWSSFATSGPRWRDQPGDWDEDLDTGMFHDDESRVGALDERERPAPDDFFAPEPEVEPAPIRTSSRPPRPGAMPHEAEFEAERDVRVAVVTGVSLAAGALILFSIGPGATMILVTAVLVLAAAELFNALRRAGYQPATLLGLVATAALALGAYWKGEPAVPLVMALTVVFTLLWYLAGVSRARPTANTAITVLAVTWVGLLGSFAALLLTHPDGVGVLVAAILTTVAYDVGGLFFGSRLGNRPLMPEISPHKTIEGLVGGMLSAIAAAVVLLYLVPGVHPWDQTITDSFVLGLVIAVVAPLGDLAESMLKRDLGVKDMGSVLPGHGGLLDRFDAILFALPATYYVVRLLEIA
jgi:phosphatidate cytidylyltransferase